MYDLGSGRGGVDIWCLYVSGTDKTSSLGGLVSNDGLSTTHHLFTPYTRTHTRRDWDTESPVEGPDNGVIVERRFRHSPTRPKRVTVNRYSLLVVHNLLIPISLERYFGKGN